jgi:hypothetical protein
MKTHRLFTTIAALLVASTGMAQDFPTSEDERNTLQVGIKGGFNNSYLYDVKGQGFVDNSLLGPAFGGFVSIPICTYLGVQPEVLYSAKGYSGNGITTDGQAYSFVDRMNFLDVPVMLQLKPLPNLYLLGGAEYSYLLSHSYTFTRDLTSETTQQQFENDNIRHTVFGLIFGIDFNLTPNLTIGGRVAWDEQDNNGNGTSTLPRYRNFWEQFTLGFRI